MSHDLFSKSSTPADPTTRHTSNHHQHLQQRQPVSVFSPSPSTNTTATHQLPPPPPAFKIKLPRAAASYTPATMDMDLRSQLNLQLIAQGHDKKIQDHLQYSLNAHPNNWPTQVQTRALALLRSGECTTFPQLLRQILDEVRRETALEPKPSNGDAAVPNGGGPSGITKKNAAAANGAGGGVPGPGEASNLHQNTTTSLAVPTAVVEEALRKTKEALNAVAEFGEVEAAT